MTKCVLRAESYHREAVSSGVDPNATNNHGHTALHLAAAHGNDLMIEALVSNGADPLRKDSERQTASDIASKNGHESFVQRFNKCVQGIAICYSD